MIARSETFCQALMIVGSKLEHNGMHDNSIGTLMTTYINILLVNVLLFLSSQILHKDASMKLDLIIIFLEELWL